jgi:hypothetical protein
MNRWRFRWALYASATCAFLLLLTFLRRLSAASQAFRLAAPSAKSTSGMQYLRPGLVITSVCRHDTPTPFSDAANTHQLSNLLRVRTASSTLRLFTPSTAPMHHYPS